MIVPWFQIRLAVIAKAAALLLAGQKLKAHAADGRLWRAEPYPLPDGRLRWRCIVHDTPIAGRVVPAIHCVPRVTLAYESVFNGGYDAEDYEDHEVDWSPAGAAMVFVREVGGTRRSPPSPQRWAGSSRRAPPATELCSACNVHFEVGEAGHGRKQGRDGHPDVGRA